MSNLTPKQISIRLPLLVSTKISALCEMYPHITKTQIIGDLLACALEANNFTPERKPSPAAKDSATILNCYDVTK